METGLVQLLPPFVELKADMVPPSNGTTTVPLGCTKGCPPIPPALFAVPIAFPHVSPPSVDVDIKSSPVSGLSHSMYHFPKCGLLVQLSQTIQFLSELNTFGVTLTGSFQLKPPSVERLTTT